MKVWYWESRRLGKKKFFSHTLMQEESHFGNNRGSTQPGRDQGQGKTKAMTAPRDCQLWMMFDRKELHASRVNFEDS